MNSWQKSCEDSLKPFFFPNGSCSKYCCLLSAVCCLLSAILRVTSARLTDWLLFAEGQNLTCSNMGRVKLSGHRSKPGLYCYCKHILFYNTIFIQIN